MTIIISPSLLLLAIHLRSYPWRIAGNLYETTLVSGKNGGGDGGRGKTEKLLIGLRWNDNY